jgi:hypothetical protein
MRLRGIFATDVGENFHDISVVYVDIDSNITNAAHL